MRARGSFTIEATIVMSALLILIVTIYYAFMAMYQYVIVTYAAAYGAQQGAAAWVNQGEGLEGAAYDDGIYYRLGELGGGGNEKTESIRRAVEEKLEGGVLFTDGTVIDVNFENTLLQRKIVVRVKQNINIPFATILKYFTDSGEFAIETQSSAVIAEPAEYIRNIDYVKELATGLLDWIGKKLGNNGSGGNTSSAVKDALKGLGG